MDKHGLRKVITLGWPSWGVRCVTCGVAVLPDFHQGGQVVGQAGEEGAALPLSPRWQGSPAPRGTSEKAVAGRLLPTRALSASPRDWAFLPAAPGIPTPRVVGSDPHL